MPSKSEKEIIFAPGGNGAAPDEAEELLPALDDMTPREIVAELDKYIVGQNAAKRAVAVALRNRVRRQKLDFILGEIIAMDRQGRIDASQLAQIIERSASARNRVRPPDAQRFEKRH